MKKINTLLVCVLLLVSCSDNQRFGGTFQADPNTDGQNGSYTGVIALLDRLYYIDGAALYTADISDPQNIHVIDEQEVGDLLETIFFNSGLLFIGSGPALYIYALGDDGIPYRFSETSYTNFDGDFFPCDPVVADKDHAYVTLSTFVEGGGWGINWFFIFPFPVCQRPIPINQLRIYNIEDITNPILTSTTNLTNPKGLAIDGDLLFVCDGPSGVKVFDVENRSSPNLITTLPDIVTFDVIARDKKLIVVGPSKIAQYDYSTEGEINLLSIYDL